MKEKFKEDMRDFYRRRAETYIQPRKRYLPGSEELSNLRWLAYDEFHKKFTDDNTPVFREEWIKSFMEGFIYEYGLDRSSRSRKR